MRCAFSMCAAAVAAPPVAPVSSATAREPSEYAARVNDRLVWIDCEMTGLDLQRDALIEIAALVTDGDLRVLGEGVDLVLHADESQLDGMPEVVREAEEQVLAYIREHVADPRIAPLAGNSIATDRGFLARDMPELDAHLHYRLVDVSSIKELCRRWFPRVFYAKPEKGMAHRALADIRESIRELDYYRRTLFVPPPGPTSEEAQAVAASLTPPTD